MERKYDLIERTNLFAKQVRGFLFQLPKGYLILEDSKQLIRSSGSVGANYIESQEPISDKDSFLRIRICRKEAKESMYWLDLLGSYNLNETQELERIKLMNEATELTKIFGTIVQKLKLKQEAGV